MYGLYRLGVGLYGLAIHLASLWQPKARLWVAGRKNWREQLNNLPNDKFICWFHTASLGEFEQGRPLMEAYRKQFPTHYILLSFFSPSGYEPRKNYQGVDKIIYLPLDSPTNARDFLQLVHPQQVIFIKYEYWYHYFMEIGKRRLPFFLVSAVFRKEQPFFRPIFGQFWRKLLQQPTQIFVQDAASALLLAPFHLNKITINSDTRFDRVIEISETKFTDSQLDHFCSGKTLIAGSSWPADEVLLQQAFEHEKLNDWKLILVPHDLDEYQIKQLQTKLGSSCLRYTENATIERLQKARYLLVDTIGLLSKIYRYGQIAYVGGGFGKGIHNTLEAAAYGLPVIFGPKHHKFLEAAELIELKAGFSIHDAQSLEKTLQLLAEDRILRSHIAALLSHYFSQKRGATERIMAELRSVLLP